MDELLIMEGGLVLAEADLRAGMPLEFFASDPSSPRAGACRARVSRAQSDALLALMDEKGDYVRLDWGASVPPTLLADHRSAALAPTVELGGDVI